MKTSSSALTGLVELTLFITIIQPVSYHKSCPVISHCKNNLWKSLFNCNDRMQVILNPAWTREIHITHNKTSPRYKWVVMRYHRVIKEMDWLLRHQHLLQKRTWEQAKLKLRQWKLVKPKVGRLCLAQCLVIIYPKEDVYLKGMYGFAYYIIVICSYIGLYLEVLGSRNKMKGMESKTLSPPCFNSNA